MPKPVLAIVSGLLWVLAFPRFDLEILAWGAWVPLFRAIEGETPRRAARLGFLAGMVFYLGGLTWITNTLVNFGGLPVSLSWLLLTLLAAYLAGFSAMFCWLLRRFRAERPALFALSAPALWTAFEYLRSTDPELGFSWLGLGYSQYRSLPVIQMAEFTGVYGVTALLVFVNAALDRVLHAFLQRPADPAARGEAWRIATAAALALALCLGYGYFTPARNPSSATAFKVALLQGNIGQGVKWDPAFKIQVMDTYRALTLRAAESRPDLIVWPEAATPFFYTLDAGETQFVHNLAQQSAAPLLLGSPYRESRGGRRLAFNSAFLVSAGGQPLGRYDKIHLVPFGEFVPFQDLLWFVRKMVAMVGDFGRGDRPVIFETRGEKFGVTICYEIIFPDLVRRSAAQGAHFLVNITNDAWFGKSAASYQHIAMAALRAVENRMPIVRSANTGISGVADADGSLRQTTELFVTDAVLAEIRPARGGPTFYTQYGDWFSYFCLLLAPALLFHARRGASPP